MLNHKYTTVLNLPLSELDNPKYAAALLEYAGEAAPPCVAEVLMNKLGEQQMVKKNTILFEVQKNTTT